MYIFSIFYITLFPANRVGHWCSNYLIPQAHCLNALNGFKVYNSLFRPSSYQFDIFMPFEKIKKNNFLIMHFFPFSRNDTHASLAFGLKTVWNTDFSLCLTKSMFRLTFGCWICRKAHDKREVCTSFAKNLAQILVHVPSQRI